MDIFAHHRMDMADQDLRTAMKNKLLYEPRDCYKFLLNICANFNVRKIMCSSNDTYTLQGWIVLDNN